MKTLLRRARTHQNRPSIPTQVEDEEEVEAKVVVADLEIRIMDISSQMTRIIMDNNSHTTQVVEEASLKAGGAKEDVALGTVRSRF